MDNAIIAAPPAKQGWKTTEFWLSLLALVVPSVGTALGGTGDPILIAIGAALTGIYTLARSGVKMASDIKTAALANAPKVIETPAGPVLAPIPGQPIEMTVTYAQPSPTVVPPSVAAAATAPKL